MAVAAGISMMEELLDDLRTRRQGIQASGKNHGFAMDSNGDVTMYQITLSAEAAEVIGIEVSLSKSLSQILAQLDRVLRHVYAGVTISGSGGERIKKLQDAKAIYRSTFGKPAEAGEVDDAGFGDPMTDRNIQVTVAVEEIATRVIVSPVLAKFVHVLAAFVAKMN
eukprot:6291846-Amphidinium_carterae.1